MHASHITAELLECRNRLTAAIQNHISGIEIHEQVVPLDIPNESNQNVGRFLTCLEM